MVTKEKKSKKFLFLENYFLVILLLFDHNKYEERVSRY